MDSEPPHSVGSYELLLELASGGMATVYIARQVGAGGFERIVVLKRVHRHLLRDRSFHEMFRDEARIASLVRHPNVVPVIDVVEARNELLLVMEYVESCSLSTMRKESQQLGRPIAPDVAARIVYDSLLGLHAAHEAVDLRGQPLEVVHRDVSPQNLIVSVDGSTRLIDFGVAKAQNRLMETRSGGVKGKFAYMAPEQVRGEPLDRRVDIFAAGIVLWETLTGERLFAGDNEMDTMRRVSEAVVPDPAQHNPAVPPGLYPVLLRALQRDRHARFSSAVDMAEALEQSVRLASPRSVAAALNHICGERLQERRDALGEALSGGHQSISSGPIPRLSTSSSWPSSGTPVSSASRSRSSASRPGLPRVEGESPQTMSFAPPSEATPASGQFSPLLFDRTPPPLDSTNPSVRSVMTRNEPEANTASLSASSLQTRFSQAPGPLPGGQVEGDLPDLSARPRGVRFAVGAVVASAVLGLALVASRSGGDGAPSSSGSSSASVVVSAPAVASSAEPAASNEVELVVRADAPIVSLRAPGMLGSEIDGQRAKLRVALWAGALTIEATLAGGKSAQVSASSSGPREVTLVTARKAEPAGAKPKRELQANPYGAP